MIISDNVYGEITITEPVIIELINSRPLQRLKEISQDGATHYLQPFRTVTRFDHSIGTWYLSKKYNRPIEEQIASLLHDVPHTAFSHVADFVMKDKNHEYHDRFFEEIVLASEIPDILQQHTIDIKKVLRKENFPLLDNKLPDLSVDRWDYFLRDGTICGIFPQEVLNTLISGLKEKDAVFYFDRKETAVLAAVLFMNCSRLLWLDPTSHGSFFLLSEAIKIAMEKGNLFEKDLFGTDNEVMEKLKEANDQHIATLLERLYSGKQFHYAPKDNAEFYGPNKPRFIDPFIKTNKGLMRVSEVLSGMNEYFEEFVTTHTYMGVVQEK